MDNRASYVVQERVWLSAIDDGEQLGPLSPQIKEGDKGFTAAWGRLHGTQVSALADCRGQLLLTVSGHVALCKPTNCLIAGSGM